MKKNMGTIDRVIRTLFAIIVAVLFFTNIISGIVAIVLAVVAGIFLLTSLVSLCPIYAIFGISSCPVQTSEGT